MNFISTSQDIFFLVLAFCILWITIFIAWIMYYAIGALKQIHQTISQLKKKLDAVDEIVNLIKEKFTASTSYLNFIVSGVGKLVTLLSKNSSEEKTKRKAK
ncbi:MAG TPA: hypothetical protein PK720_00615 [bacterium]|jgi:CHASE3 domain sensor protein|nr:hypothetical protein [bacterium]